jgi:ATP-dependent helicase/nuclease subunit B
LQLFTIDPGIPFTDALAAGLLAESGGDPAILATHTILLPTRRACRNLRDTFLRLSHGRPLLLPRLQPLGDVDGDELALETAQGADSAALLSLPPAIPPLRRAALLARLVMKLPEYGEAPHLAFALAESLGALMDRVYTENLDLAGLAALAPGDYAAHWQITLSFLEILSRSWPEILAAEGVIDAADRRNRLLLALAVHWRAHPPAGPVTAAGATGSTPAAAKLLQTIAALPQGRVVFPGLDRAMDDASWDALEDSHPQAAMKTLLAGIGADRRFVRDWPHAAPEPPGAAEPPALREAQRDARAWLASELMRPAATAEAWTHLNAPGAGAPERDALRRSLAGLERYDCDTPEEEAHTIALLLRETLEIPGRRAALVTPDRRLARRVATACQRWGIEIDDSAGSPLPATPVGAWLALCAQCCLDEMRPRSFAALLKHKLCAAKEHAAAIETRLLRGAAPDKGFAGLYKRLAAQENAAALAETLRGLEEKLAPFLALCGGEAHDFSALLDAHIAIAENLSAGPQELWQGEAGEAAALFLAGLREEAALMPRLDAASYLAVFAQLAANVTVRPAYGTHPRLAILGQIEARLVQPDLVIMGGLNEGTWPAQAAADPWMSRPMRQAFGLPSPEVTAGLSAHDFAQGFCAPRAAFTRARRVDGTPAVPSRWLQRLDTLLAALGCAPEEIQRGAALGFARALDLPDGPPLPAPRPAPRPPADKRPTSLYVTAIERWMRDPYSIYARYILGLRRMEEIEEDADAALRGTLVHTALERFIRESGDTPPEGARERLLAIGAEEFEKASLDPGRRAFWWPRFTRIAEWFTGHERDWREERGARPLALEATGSLALPGFTLNAKADRIDLLADGSAAIIDYKTGGAPTKGEIEGGYAPQLPLEAAILKAGGFADTGARAPGYLGFWRMSGGHGEDESFDRPRAAPAAAAP